MNESSLAQRVGKGAWGLRLAVREHLAWMRGRCYAEASIDHRRRCLADLVRWLGRRRCTRVTAVTSALLDKWASELACRRKHDGGSLSPATKANLLYAARGFFRDTRERGLIVDNPAATLRVAAPPPSLPRAIPTLRAILRVLDAPDLRTKLGVRDRALLELLYATGIRRGELAELRVDDLDADRGSLLVRRGKGGRGRRVPVGRRATAWVARYLEKVRPGLVSERSGTVLFLGRHGQALRPNTLADRLRPYVRVSAAVGSCHVFRHACATHMLEGGADIRFVQEMLGHARLSTTQVYAHVSISALKHVHAATHPSALLGDPRRRSGSRKRGVEHPGWFRVRCRRGRGSDRKR